MKAHSLAKTPTYEMYHRGSTRDVAPETRGGFALMGGATDQDEAFCWMAERSGGGDFLVLRGSGSDGYQEYIDGLADLNSVTTIVIKDRAAAEDEQVLERVRNAEAIFFAGGDQWNYVGKWKNTSLQAALNQAILNGVPVGGTSAGLAILGEHVFTAEVGSVTSAEALADPYDPSVTISSDFLQAQPLQGLVTDTHFTERNRLGRLVTFMARAQEQSDTEQMRGLGVDERTVVLVEPNGSAEVIGEGGAHFVKANNKPAVLQKGEPLIHRGLELTSLYAGEHFDFTTWASPEVQPKSLTAESGKLIVE